MAPSKPRVSEQRVDPKALAQVINKKFGEGTIRSGSDPYFMVKRIPTGVLTVDYLLGGGFPRGRHVEIYGGYAVGKTALVYSTIAQAQALGLECAFVDAERTFDPSFAESQGVDPKRLLIHSQEYGDRCVDLMETLLTSRGYGVIALDSIASLLPKSEKEAAMEEGAYGTAQAKMMSKALRKLTASNRDTVLIYINQLRDNIGLFGKKDRTAGGRSMAYYASTRLELTRTETIRRKARVIDPSSGDTKVKELVTGHRVLCRVEKEKASAKTGAITSFVFDYRLSTIDPVEDLLYLGRRLGFVGKRGNTWRLEGYEDEAQNGRKRFHRWLTTNRAIAEELTLKIREQFGEEEPEIGTDDEDE